VNSENTALANKDALDLLNQMLKYDHFKRITPRDALEHAYCAPIRAQAKGNKK
jgi:casein kinase II subunit alpha